MSENKVPYSFTLLDDDGYDAELGRTWTVESAPLSGPLGIRTALHGLVGERLDPSEFYWESWHDVTIMGDEHYGSGYVASFEKALEAAVRFWQGSPLAQAAPYAPAHRWTFQERMSGGPR